MIVVFAAIVGIIIAAIAWLVDDKTHPAPNTVVALINIELPQLQCGLCNHASCLLYAKAIVNNKETMNKCTPGGTALVARLANIIGETNQTTDNGLPLPLLPVAIQENSCIGCTVCLEHCPVDAIVGAQGLLHTIIQEKCTACGLCVKPCPVDCIVSLQ